MTTSDTLSNKSGIAIRHSRIWRNETQRVARFLKVKPRRRSELGLMVVGIAVVISAMTLASLAATNQIPPHVYVPIAIIIGVCVIIQIINRYLVPFADPVIMPITLVLNGMGWIMIKRLEPLAATSQLLWTVVGIGVYTLTLVFIRRSRDLDKYRYLIGFFAFFLLLTPLIPHFGYSVDGARLWVRLSSTLEFQPVEIAKILLVVFFASFFAEKKELFAIPTKRVGNVLLPDLRVLGPVALAAGAALLIILAEKDVGFSLIIFLVFLMMLWAASGRWGYVIIGVGLFGLATFFAAHILGQIGGRFAVWIDPWKYYNTSGYYAGYQPVQGELAFGRGGMFGSGLGLGLVHYIPNQGTTPLPVATSDFIFAVFGEELGLVGTTALMVGYVLIIGAGLRAAARAKSDFTKLLCLGLILTFGLQTFFIMAGVTRLLPLTGVTLPLVSYGGSSLVANYALIALLMRISDETNTIAS
ncbi:MAG: FtsW/RodA/SpoVE family cell cycle protein [Firmicutes bacterium]|jgi:peptidoglycan glycosyltransferase|nr:FtsW/RodA/SpoVE family cell cycle protein [Bacillota bacterium]